jgi:hypothetical protein
MDVRLIRSRRNATGTMLYENVRNVYVLMQTGLGTLAIGVKSAYISMVQQGGKAV